MGSRKQLKSTHSAADSQTSPTPPKSSGAAHPARTNNSTPRKSVNGGSWTTKSWPRGQKAAAVTEVARESISAGNIASELVSSTASLPNTSKVFRTTSIQLTKAGASSRSLPADATTTRVNIGSNGSSITAPSTETAGESPEVKNDAGKPEEKGSLENNTSTQSSQTLHERASTEAQNHIQQPENPAQQNTTHSSWFGWLGWNANAGDQTSSKQRDMCDPNDEAKPNPAPQNDPETSEVSNNVTKAGEDPKTSVAPNTTEQDTAAQTPVPQKRSWMQMWGGSNVNKLKEDSQIDPSSEEPVAEQDQPSDQPVVAPPTNESSVVEDSQERKRDSGPSKSSGWAFWSRDVPNTGTQPAAQQEESGELILSEQILSKTNKDDSVPQPELKSILSSPKAENKKRIKTVPPTNTVNGKATKTTGPITEDGVTSIPTDDAIATPIPAKVKSQEVTASKQLQSVLSNQLLPAFKDTFALQESASWLQTLGRLLHYTKQPENQHVFVLRDPPLFKKALAIGVHGYFPAPYLRTVLGQPTGTSLKFSTMAAKAIHRWAESHGYHCDVEKISLEGEGRIAERVDLLWKLLLNWMEDIRRAEFIMFACHSQGVPVTIMLVAKLIAFGCLDASRVGICAMAGVNQGPFPDYKSRWIGGSAGELFDFANPTTKVSKDYEMALKTCLEFGVRITYVGSIDDQLVSLESSLFDPVSHPYIYRAVFVDGKVHAPSFLSHLVGFTLKLRNLGIRDHGLIRELSAPLVGSLVGGEGHSRLHDEENIYHMAVEFALETSNVNVPLHIQRHSLTTTPNPYILPFALRGLLEEDYVRHELHQESLELLKQFDDWKPTTKVLKDVKFRLEGIRSKL